MVISILTCTVFSHSTTMVEHDSVQILPSPGKFHCVNLKHFNIVTRDLPGGKRILKINIRAQHITFGEAIKAYTIGMLK